MDAQKAVLVTGASTGIGRKITEHLALKGCFVYAGARKDSDLRALGSLERVHPLRLDVTSVGDIAAAAKVVASAGRGLFGLVNNAGVATLGPLADGDDSEFDEIMTVNVYGPYRVTKAFAPLIATEKGRITTIGSIAGILAKKNVGAYSMSKHAIEAFTDSLAVEMESVGVHVSVIEPGDFKSDILKNAARRVGAASPVQDRSIFAEPDAVAVAVAAALFDPNPKRRYLVSSEDEARSIMEKQIEQLLQLNDGHSHTRGREALVAMLDDALARLRQESA